MTRKAERPLPRTGGRQQTMLAKNLGLRALERGHTVVFANLSSALADLLRQESLPAVERRLRRYTAANLVILDESGYQPVDARAVDLLFQIVSRRHEHASTILDELTLQGLGERVSGAACFLVPLVDPSENMIAFDIRGPSYRRRTRPTPKPPPPRPPKKRA
ncbi:MAG: ATP-binding protein [Myxococcales bacterium]|nr:ATP-binding protein [Myxococcales bacterium]